MKNTGDLSVTQPLWASPAQYSGEHHLCESLQLNSASLIDTTGAARGTWSQDPRSPNLLCPITLGWTPNLRPSITFLHPRAGRALPQWSSLDPDAQELQETAPRPVHPFPNLSSEISLTELKCIPFPQSPGSAFLGPI